MSMVSDQFYS